MKQHISSNKKTLRGTVTSTKMDKTVVVAVESYVKHPKYGKYYIRTKKYKAHLPEGSLKEGDIVTIRECAPVSKDKHFEVVAS